MPPISFDVKGSSGSTTLQISARNYVINAKDGCSLAFGAMQYPTEQNGPVWVLGLPLFYQYSIGYDVQQNSLSFSSGSCSSCGGGSSFERLQDVPTLETPFRRSSVNTSIPL